VFTEWPVIWGGGKASSPNSSAGVGRLRLRSKPVLCHFYCKFVIIRHCLLSLHLVSGHTVTMWVQVIIFQISGVWDQLERYCLCSYGPPKLSRVCAVLDDLPCRVQKADCKCQHNTWRYVVCLRGSAAAAGSVVCQDATADWMLFCLCTHLAAGQLATGCVQLQCGHYLSSIIRGMWFYYKRCTHVTLSFHISASRQSNKICIKQMDLFLVSKLLSDMQKASCQLV